MNNTNNKPLASLALCALLAACGGGGDGSGSSSGGTAAPQTAQGVFVDAPVSGLAYVSGAVSGTTDASGHFNYVPGQTVTFSVGGVTVGSAAGQAVLTPLSLVPGASDVTDDTVTNIGAFLQSLDAGGNPASAIVISAASAAALAKTQLNFAQAPAAFAADPAVTAAIQAASPQKALVSAAAAQAHMQNQSLCLYAGQWKFSGSDRSNDPFVVTISEVDGSITGSYTRGDGTQAFLTGKVAYNPTSLAWAIKAQANQQLSYPANTYVADALNGAFTSLNSAAGNFTGGMSPTYNGNWTATRVSTAPACGGTATPSLPQGAIGYADYHYNAQSMVPSLASILSNGVGVAGTLNLGGRAITVTPQADGGFLWGSPVAYGMNYLSLASDATLPAASMVCMTANSGDGTDGLKSTDVLVAQTATKVTAATDLAGITFSQYWEDCRLDGLPAASPATVHGSIVVDAAGNATISTAGGGTPVTLSAAQVTALLSGAPSAAVGLGGSTWFQAYRVVSAGRTRYLLVEHGIFSSDTSGGYVGAWLQ